MHTFIKIVVHWLFLSVYTRIIFKPCLVLKLNNKAVKNEQLSKFYDLSVACQIQIVWLVNSYRNIVLQHKISISVLNSSTWNYRLKPYRKFTEVKLMLIILGKSIFERTPKPRLLILLTLCWQQPRNSISFLCFSEIPQTFFYQTPPD